MTVWYSFLFTIVPSPYWACVTRWPEAYVITVPWAYVRFDSLRSWIRLDVVEPPTWGSGFVLLKSGKELYHGGTHAARHAGSAGTTCRLVLSC